MKSSARHLHAALSLLALLSNTPLRSQTPETSSLPEYSAGFEETTAAIARAQGIAKGTPEYEKLANNRRQAYRAALEREAARSSSKPSTIRPPQVDPAFEETTAVIAKARGILPGTPEYEDFAKRRRTSYLEAINREFESDTSTGAPAAKPSIATPAEALRALVQNLESLEKSAPPETAKAARAAIERFATAASSTYDYFPDGEGPPKRQLADLVDLARLARRLPGVSPRQDPFTLKPEEAEVARRLFADLVQQQWKRREEWLPKLRQAAEQETEQKGGDSPRFQALAAVHRSVIHACEPHLMARHALGGPDGLREGWREVSVALGGTFAPTEAFVLRCQLARQLLLGKQAEVERAGVAAVNSLFQELPASLASGDTTLDELAFSTAVGLLSLSAAHGLKAPVGSWSRHLERGFPALHRQHRDTLSIWITMSEGGRVADTALNAPLAHAIIRSTPAAAKLATFLELSPHLYDLDKRGGLLHSLPADLAESAKLMASAVLAHTASLPPEKQRHTLADWRARHEAALAKPGDGKPPLIAALAFSALAEEASRTPLHGLAPPLVEWTEKLLVAAKTDAEPAPDYFQFPDRILAVSFETQIRWRLARIDPGHTFDSFTARRLQLEKRHVGVYLDWRQRIGAPTPNQNARHQNQLRGYRDFLAQDNVLDPQELEADFIRFLIDAPEGIPKAMEFISTRPDPARQVALYRQLGAELANRANPGWPRY
jgi:hypothetical protein